MPELLLMFLFPLLLSISIAFDDNTFIIHNVNDFVTFVSNVNNRITNYTGSTVILDNDIVFTKELSDKFEPIGKWNESMELRTPFYGTFDGQGHTISNLEIYSLLPSVGLFGHAYGLTIRNVIIDSSCSVAASYNEYDPYIGYYATIGGFIGYCGAAERPCIVENSVNMANLTYFSIGKIPYDIYMGGIIGDPDPDAFDVVIRNCVNYGTIYLGDAYRSIASIGGIAGSCTEYVETKRYIQNCMNYGEIIYNGTTQRGTSAIGGILGTNFHTNYFESCLSAGTITLVNDAMYVGAITGSGDYNVNNITNCLWTSGVGNYNASGYGNTSTITDTSLVEESAETVNEMNERSGQTKWLYNPTESLITFSVNGNVAMSSTSKIILLPDLAGSDGDDGNTFFGWFTDNTCDAPLSESTVHGTTTLYGGWAYTATFDYGNTTKATKRVIYKQLYGELPEGYRTGYALGGWFTDESYEKEITEVSIVSATSDHTLYAQWTPNTYVVTLNVNGGDTLPNNSTEVIYDSPYGELQSPTREGYTFSGWFIDTTLEKEINSSSTVSISNNHTLYVRWEPNNYTVTLDVNGGDALPNNSTEVTYDNPYGELPEATRDGYTFSGWFIDMTYKDKITSSSIVSIPNNHTLYAQWTSAYVQITFNSKDLTKDNINDFISGYTDDKFVIEKITTNDNGETVVIIRFTDVQEATSFITTINVDDDNSVIKGLGFIDAGLVSHSPTFIPFFVSVLLCLV